MHIWVLGQRRLSFCLRILYPFLWSNATGLMFVLAVALNRCCSDATLTLNSLSHEPWIAPSSTRARHSEDAAQSLLTERGRRPENTTDCDFMCMITILPEETLYAGAPAFLVRSFSSSSSSSSSS